LGGVWIALAITPAPHLTSSRQPYRSFNHLKATAPQPAPSPLSPRILGSSKDKTSHYIWNIIIWTPPNYLSPPSEYRLTWTLLSIYNHLLCTINSVNLYPPCLQCLLLSPSNSKAASNLAVMFSIRATAHLPMQHGKATEN